MKQRCNGLEGVGRNTESWVLSRKLPVQEEGSGSHLIGCEDRTEAWAQALALLGGLRQDCNFSRLPVFVFVFY